MTTPTSTPTDQATVTQTNGYMPTPDDATPSMLITALAYQQAGRSVLPIAPGEKRPSILNTHGEVIGIAWDAYQSTPADEATLRAWFPNDRPMGIGIACGPVSGMVLDGVTYALEILDVDDEQTLEAFIEAAHFQGLSELLQRLLHQRTPGGAGHFASLCAQWAGNTKLAQRQEGVDQRGKPQIVTLIETRGAGGQAVVAPTPPGIHPEYPERGYELIRGSWEDVPIITPEERQALWDLARSFNAYVEPVQVHAPRGAGKASARGNRPGDWLNRTGDRDWWRTLLERHDWTLVQERRGIQYWCRPGKEGKAWSATLGACGDYFYVFSSNASPFQPEKAYLPFAAYGFLEHHGDFQAAARALIPEHFAAAWPGEIVALTLLERLVGAPEARLVHEALPTLTALSPDAWQATKSAIKRLVGDVINLSDVHTAWKKAHRPQAQPTPTNGTHPPEATPLAARDDGRLPLEESWTALLILNKHNIPSENVSNISLLLEQHEHWCGRLWFDTVRQQPMLDDSPLDDAAITAIGRWLGTHIKMSVRSLRLIERCAMAICGHAQRDLLRKWVLALPAWDGVQRLHDWLSDVAAAPKDVYSMDVSRLVPVSMVARALHPGCQYRNVVIVEGPEDSGKSKLVRALASPEWYVELAMGLESKEAHMMLQGAWVAELAELDSLSRTEETRLKAFLTLREDTWIPKYSNFRTSTPRRTIFIGTTNEGTYLKGQTGNTRFLPIKTGAIDTDMLEAMRDQLFAEALVYYQTHPTDWWQLSTDGESAALLQREQRRVTNVYESDLGEWLDVRRFAEEHFVEGRRYSFVARQTSWAEIARYYLKIETPQGWKDKALQMQIGQALRALGWELRIDKDANRKSLRLWHQTNLSTSNEGTK